MDETQPESPGAPSGAGTNGASGVEKEIIEKPGEIPTPLHPSEIRIETRTERLDYIISKLKENELDLSSHPWPESGDWSDEVQSRLIESVLVRIPLPSFYFSVIDDTRWRVADGLRRLSVIKRFVIDNELALTGLEFLTGLGGKTHRELPAAFRRRIRETEVTVHMMEKGTTPEAAFRIFRRINTTGRPLSSQEIRDLLQQGNAAGILRNLSASEEFRNATDNSIQEDGMEAQECVLRFIAFTITPRQKYEGDDFDGFLNNAMASLNKMFVGDIENVIKLFFRSMSAAHAIFGKFAFRKIQENSVREPINKSLFETWAVCLSRLSDDRIAALKSKKADVLEGFIRLLRDGDFERSLCVDIGAPANVELRFSRVEQLIREVLA